MISRLHRAALGWQGSQRTGAGPPGRVRGKRGRATSSLREGSTVRAWPRCLRMIGVPCRSLISLDGAAGVPLGAPASVGQCCVAFPDGCI